MRDKTIWIQYFLHISWFESFLNKGAVELNWILNWGGLFPPSLLSGSPLYDVWSGCTYEKLSKHCSSSLNLHFCLYRSSVRLTSNTLSRLLSILSVVSLWQGSAPIPSRISLSPPLDRTVPPHGCSSTQSGLCHQHVLFHCWGIFALHIDHATDLTHFDADANITKCL